MRSEMKSVVAAAAALVALSACSGAGEYDKWAESTNRKISTSYTELINGKQTVEIDPDVPKDAVINIAYRLGEGVGLPGRAASPFYNKLTGDVTYSKSCKTSLSFKVALINKENALVRTESVFVESYDSGVKALISKDVLTDPTKQGSSQVVKLRVKDFQCLPQSGAMHAAPTSATPTRTLSDAEQFKALTAEQKAKVMGQSPDAPKKKSSKPGK